MCRLRAFLQNSCRTIPMGSFMYRTHFIMRRKPTYKRSDQPVYQTDPVSVDVDSYAMVK